MDKYTQAPLHIENDSLDNCLRIFVENRAVALRFDDMAEAARDFFLPLSDFLGEFFTKLEWSKFKA